MDKISRKKQNIISAIIVIVGVYLAFTIFGPKENKQAEAEKLDFATQVEVMNMGQEVSKMAEVSKTAIFESNDSAEAVAEQAGRIVSVNFKVGDYVQKGQVLASFDQSDLVNSNKVALEDSLENLRLAEDNLKKTKKSADEALEIAENNRRIDELELEQAEDDGDKDEIDLAERNLENSKDAEDKAEEDRKITVNNAKIQVSQAQSTVRQNRVAYEKSIVRAPVSGTVTSKNVNRYDYINAGTGIAEISGASVLNAKVFLSGFEVARVSEGDLVKIIIDGKEYSGKITSLSTVANSNNNRFEVRVESVEDIFRAANRPAEVRISLKLNSEEQGVFFVPLAAVSIGQQKNTVFKVDGDVARLTEIELGKTVGDQVEILGGLKEGDKLIVVNNRGLRDNEKIEIK